MDCAPVEKAGYTTAVASGDVPQLVVTTRHGSAVVPPDIPLRESKDHRMHACMRPEGRGRMRITCIFRPTQQLNVDRSGCRSRATTGQTPLVGLPW
jgi:hypothetical protein